MISFSDGSVGNLLYTSRGSLLLAKEYLEVHGASVSATLHDFRSCDIFDGRRAHRVRGRGKGHEEEMDALLETIRSGTATPFPVEVAIRTSRATLAVRAALSGSTGESRCLS